MRSPCNFRYSDRFHCIFYIFSLSAYSLYLVTISETHLRFVRRFCTILSNTLDLNMFWESVLLYNILYIELIFHSHVNPMQQRKPGNGGH